MKPKPSPFTWRDDPDVPDFPDAGLICVMDASCGLCAKGATWIARNDRDARFRIIPLQSPLGAALIRHFGMDPADPLSWLFLEDGMAHGSVDAMIRVGRQLGGTWRALGALRLLPRSLRDWAYGVIARNRYKLMGRADLCAMPDPAVQARLLQ